MEVKVINGQKVVVLAPDEIIDWLKVTYGPITDEQANEILAYVDVEQKRLKIMVDMVENGGLEPPAEE